VALARALSSIRLVSLGVLLLLAAGCETIQTGSDYDRAASFAGYHSFSIVSRQLSNPFVVDRVDNAIRGYLQGRGYVYAADPTQADFTVDFALGSQEPADIQPYPDASAGRWYDGPGWRGGPDLQQYREGTLSVDIFDNKTHRPVWHGWGTKTLSESDIEESQETIDKAVASVLKNFPPHS
jgi:hypothetical protein